MDEYLTVTPETTSIEVVPGDHLVFETGPFLAMVFGQVYGSPSAGFAHPNVLARGPRVAEFKRHAPNGGKYWVAKPVIEHLLVFRKEDVHFKRAKGNSYPEVRVASVEFFLNVSGGTDRKGGWCDWIRNPAHAPGWAFGISASWPTPPQVLLALLPSTRGCSMSSMGSSGAASSRCAHSRTA